MKTGFITIAGRSNVGKSTLLNAIVGEKIAIVSDKPQTTRNKIVGIYNKKDLQLVFVDTPGVHMGKNRLDDYMAKEATQALYDVDCVILVVEPRMPGKIELDIIARVKKEDIPIILVINKVDITKKEKVAYYISEYASIHDFASIIPASALKQDNLNALMSEILKITIDDGTAIYPDDIITSQSERQMVAEIMREKLLRRLSEEVPHGIAIETVIFKNREDKPIIDISLGIICEKASHKGIIIGKNGQTLKIMASHAREDMEKLLGKQVYLECFVKVKEGWRNDEAFIKQYDQ